MSTSIFQKWWKLGQQLLLDGNLNRTWDGYVEALRKDHIHLGARYDVLIWDKNLTSGYSPKVGYISISVDLFNRGLKCW